MKVSVKLIGQNTLVPRISNIKKLKIRYWEALSYQFQLQAQAPDFSSLTYLEDLNLLSLNPPTFPQLPRSIKTLNVSGWYRCRGRVGQENFMSKSVDELVSLSMSGFVTLSTADLFTLLAPNKGNLRTLDISRTDIDFGRLFADGYLSGVTELAVNRTPIGDETVEILAANLPHLITLAISNTCITGVGVRALTKKTGRQLEWLDLNYCSSVGVDAVVYARSLGIKVSNVLIDSSKGR